MLNPKYKGLLVDLDDTLLDFTKSEALSLNTTHKQFYQEIISEADFLSTFHTINSQLWQDLEVGKVTPQEVSSQRFALLNKSVRSSVLSQDVVAFYADQLIKNSLWLPGAEDAIKTLKERFQICVITNGFSNVQRGKYKLYNMEDWAESFIVSEEVGVSKPHKDIFDIALKSCGLLPHQTLMIGNSLTSDYQGAINAGIDFCWVKIPDIDLPQEFPTPAYSVLSISELIKKFDDNQRNSTDKKH